MTSKEKAEVIGTLAMTILAIAYMVIMLHQECPGCQSRWLRLKQWAKYHQWVAKFKQRPTWEQEALIVRGLAPSDL